MRLASAFLSLIFAATACNAQRSSEVRMEGSVLFVDGRLDETLISKVREYDLSKVETVSISSEGGLVRVAFAFLDLWDTDKVVLRVRGHCFSACATIILPGFSQRYLASDAILALHTTQLGLKTLYDSLDVPIEEKGRQSAEVARLAKREVALYKQAGINASLLLVPYIARGEMCYTNLRQPNGTWAFSVGTRRPAVFVSPADLRRFGMVFMDGSPDGTGHGLPDPSQIAEQISELDIQQCVASG